MLKVKLLHNPKAGDKDHSEEKMTALVANAGFNVVYTSIKDEGWEKIEKDVDILAVAGGDGTVRKVARVALKSDHPYLIGVMAMGTANNIARTLQISGGPEEIVRSWANKNTRSLDAAMLTGLPEPNFFMEGFGYGLFPELMMQMKKIDKRKLDTPAKEIHKATEVLREIVLGFEATYCRIVIDGVSHSGSYLLVEVMNICSIGPNLKLAPDADPGDGVLEVVVIPADQRLHFADFLQHNLNGVECPPFAFQTLRGSNIQIKWDGTDMHADDELIKTNKPVEVGVQIRPGALQFIVP